MKKFLPLIACALILASCEPKPERVVESEWTPEQPKLVAYYIEEGEKKIKQTEEKYYENGNLEYRGSYDADGKRHGDWMYNYQNGNVWSTGSYEHGKRTGEKEVFWPEGQLRYNGAYLNDEKTGHWVFYDLDGSIIEEKDF